MKHLAIILSVLLMASPLTAQEHGRGYIPPSAEVKSQRSAAMKARHDSRMALLPKQTDATFDCVAKGWAIPIGDQGSCGSCWLYSAVDNISSCYVKNGYGPNWRFSYQHMMDCGPNSNPCGGGDEYDIFQVAKSDGLITEADYGVAYKAARGQCRATSSMKRWKIGDFLYCDPVQQSGRTSVQAIKNAMVSYGMVSIALSADRMSNYSGGVITTGQNIDHAVNIVGWDDGKQAFAEKKSPLDLPVAVGAAGAFKIQNQWSTQWGLQGYCWVSYSSYLVEGMVCSVAPLPPPPPPPDPTPVPPGPQPGTLYKMVTNADGSITFIPTSNGEWTPEKIKAFQDEIQKLQDMLKQSKASPKMGGCGNAEELKALKKRIEELESGLGGLKKTVDSNAEKTTKNLSDLIEIIKEDQKAIKAMMDKKPAASANEPSKNGTDELWRTIYENTNPALLTAEDREQWAKLKYRSYK